MKRFHVHAHVDDLQASVAFYSKLFGAEPTRLETDYAKWMLEDPCINFAISSRGGKPGVDHLGFQTDTEEELVELKQRAQAADLSMLDEGQTTCCYARSDKYWLTDPQGIAWEQYHTLGDIPVFNEPAKSTEQQATACCAQPANVPNTVVAAEPAASCCGSASRGKPVGIAVNASSSSSCC